VKTRPYLVHALSPLHAGVGQAADVIDLPTARMKATGIPYVPGSSIKGVLRDVRGGDDERAEAVFGPPPENASAHAGALVVTDARLLAMPVRSFQGVFVWATSPLLLTLARRDLARDLPALPPGRDGRCAWVPPQSVCLVENKLYLEDLDLPAQRDETVGAWAALLAPLVSPPGSDIFTGRLAVLDDETMVFLFETGTQVDTHVRIDDTGTVAPGALWLEESLPPETLLIGLLSADRSRKSGVDMTPDDILDYVLPAEKILQFGGRATTGKGRCRMIPVEAG